MRLQLVYVLALTVLAGLAGWWLGGALPGAPWWVVPLGGMYLGQLVGFVGRRLWDWSQDERRRDP